MAQRDVVDVSLGPIFVFHPSPQPHPNPGHEMSVLVAIVLWFRLLEVEVVGVA